jgi:amidohydrolase
MTTQQSASKGIDMRRAQLLNDVRPRVIGWRRHLHSHPELSFEEHETARYIAEVLREFGLEPVHPTPTSVTATITGGRPGRTVAVRADIDALPIQEESGVSFASRTPGVMHACGHDCHAATVLGVAAVLSAMRDELAGRFLLVFQHAEERHPHGAPELIAAGVLDGVDAIIAAHVWPPFPLGVVGLSHGQMLASTDVFEVGFVGRGGHAAMPHDSRDPIAAVADFVHAMQRLVAREIDPLQSAVVSVTRIHAGDAFNVISERAEAGGTFRAFSADVRMYLRDRIEQLAMQVAASHRMEVETTFRAGVPPLANTAAITDVIARAARTCAGVTELRDPVAALGGEDFACYLEHVPGAYVFIGAGQRGTGGPFPHHHPRFVVEEDALAIGTGILTGAAASIADPTTDLTTTDDGTLAAATHDS